LTKTIEILFVIGRRNPRSSIVLVKNNDNDLNRNNSPLYYDELVLALDLLSGYFM
jgi:hypothetical protein